MNTLQILEKAGVSKTAVKKLCKNLTDHAAKYAHALVLKRRQLEKRARGWAKLRTMQGGRGPWPDGATQETPPGGGPVRVVVSKPMHWA